MTRQLLQTDILHGIQFAAFGQQNHGFAQSFVFTFRNEKGIVQMWRKESLHFFYLNFQSSRAHHVVTSAQDAEPTVGRHFGNVVGLKHTTVQQRCIDNQTVFIID